MIIIMYVFYFKTNYNFSMLHNKLNMPITLIKKRSYNVINITNYIYLNTNSKFVI